MSKRELPFHCSLCENRFNSRGDLKRHHNAVHVTVRSFPELKPYSEPYRPVVPLGLSILAVVVSLASASFFWALSGVAIEQQLVPAEVWGMWTWHIGLLVSTVIGGLAGMFTLALRPKTVAKKQQKSVQKAA